MDRFHRSTSRISFATFPKRKSRKNHRSNSMETAVTGSHRWSPRKQTSSNHSYPSDEKKHIADSIDGKQTKQKKQTNSEIYMLDIDLLLWLNHFSLHFFLYFSSSFWGTVYATKIHQRLSFRPPGTTVSPKGAPAIATALQSMQQGDMDAVG